MTREEIIQFLQENLTIDIQKCNYHEWDDGITVTLMIDGAPISEASVGIK